MITLTKEEAQQVLDAFVDWDARGRLRLIKTLRAKLSAPEPEPVADKYLMEVECTKCGAKQDGILTVTAPPQRQWQGLTEQQHANIAVEAGCASADWVFYGAAVERALKEKNT